MVNDPIADFLTRLRNGLLARKVEVEANCSKMSKRLAEILVQCGYIKGVSYETLGPRKVMKVALGYDAEGRPLAEGFKRISRPGLRNYSGVSDIPAVRGGMGISIVSTSKGVMTGSEAKEKNVGGEVLCVVW